MADDPRYRSPSFDPYSRDRPPRSASPQDDPLAELARLIGQDEAFIAASRESARARQRDASHDREAESSAPNWLARATGGRTPRDDRTDAYAKTDWRDTRSADEFETEAGHPQRQAAREWDPRSEETDSHYGRSMQDARDDRYETGDEAPAAEEFDPHRIAGEDRRYDRLQGEEAYERYEEERGRGPRIDPFDSRDDDRPDEAPHSGLRRRGGILTIAAVLGLAVVGTAAAFGYRAWTGGSSPAGQPPLIKADTAPTKVVPAQIPDGQQNKLIYDRIGEKIQSSNDRMVSREEQPVELRDMGRQPGARPGLPPPGTAGNVTIGGQPPAYAAPPAAAVGANEPKKVHTITIRPDQMPPPGPGAAESPPSRSVPTTNIGPAAAPATPTARSPAPAGPSPIKPVAPKPAASAPLALNPEPAPGGARSGAASVQPAPYRTAALPSGAESGNYVVQISSQRSESEAQASFRALQQKYPNVLGSRQALIRRADLGNKGVYYRAQVGPFATADDANQLCSNLKAAGGQCIVQRN